MWFKIKVTNCEFSESYFILDFEEVNIIFMNFYFYAHVKNIDRGYQL